MLVSMVLIISGLKKKKMLESIRSYQRNAIVFHTYVCMDEWNQDLSITIKKKKSKKYSIGVITFQAQVVLPLF